MDFDVALAKLNKDNQASIAKGAQRGAILSEMQKDRKDKPLKASIPKELHMQMVEHYGSEYSKDSVLVNDMKRLYPQMCCLDGDTPPPRWGSKPAYRQVRGVWYKRQEDGSYAPGEPPSKMNWGKDPPPKIID